MNELFTNLAHELLTPLTILTASIDHTLGNSARHKDDYYTMILNIQRMQHLLQQILETSKQQSGNLKLLVANGDVMATHTHHLTCRGTTHAKERYRL